MEMIHLYVREYLILVPAITWIIVVVLKAVFLFLKGKFTLE
jgi:hypothetical protein